MTMMELREDIGPLRRRTAFLFLLVFTALGLLQSSDRSRQPMAQPG
jgi:hypothetical protein